MFIRYLVGLCEKCRHASDVRPLEGARAVSMAIIFLDVRRGSIAELYKVLNEDHENRGVKIRVHNEKNHLISFL